MTRTVAGIPTLYGGVEFRSRLEARWAAFGRSLGWDMIYEPFDGHGYIPDFLVQGASPFLIEVKPAITWADYEQPVNKIERGLSGIWAHDVLVVGASPIGPRCREMDRPTAGLIGDSDRWTLRGPVWGWNDGAWFQCRECTKVCIFDTIMSFRGRPCGCYDGDGHLGHVVESLIRRLWAEAGNDVKWRGRDAN